MVGKNNFGKIDFLLLTAILIAAFILRLYKIDTPLADLHSWRQADTAAVARNFLRFGFDLLHPRFDDLTSRESGLENPQGYRMVEFPIYNASFALIYRYLPLLSLEVLGRLVSIFFSLLTLVVVYYLALKETDRLAAFFSALTYAIMPFFVFFSRVILPEPTSLGLAMLSVLLLYLAVKNKKTSLGLATLSCATFALALLVKPTSIFCALPLLFIFIKKYSLSALTKWWLYFYFLSTTIPLLAWRLHIQQFPEGIPASAWLLTKVNTSDGIKEIFFRPAFFRWIFMERLGIAIFGIYLSIFFILGLIVKNKKYLLYSIYTAAFLYLFTFQGGNVQHEYYQIFLFPALTLAIGAGCSFFLKAGRNIFYPFLAYPLLFLIFVGSFFFSYYKVKDYYLYPSDLIRLAKIIQSVTKEDELIVTDRNGDTTLLYLANRRGAPSVYKSPAELKDIGYMYLITTNPDMIKKLRDENYSTVVENDRFALFKL